MKEKRLIYYTGVAVFLAAILILLFIFHDKTATNGDGTVNNSAQNTNEFRLNVQEFKTKSGTRVLYLERPEIPIVDVSILFDAGSRHDQQSWGLASLTSATLFTGADGLTEDDIAQQFEEIGANFSASSSREMASVSFRSLTEKKLLKKAVSLMQSVLKAPSFEAGAFELMQRKILIGLKQSKEDPSHIAYETFFKVLYKDTPYAHLPDGDEQHVTALKPEDAKNFYNQYYNSKKALIVIVGSLSKRHAQNLANDLAESLPENSQTMNTSGYQPDFEPGDTSIKFAGTQTHVLAGMPFITYDDPDYFPLYVGNHILGGNALLSRIFKEVRETRGLAYDARSYFVPMQIKGPYIFGLQTKNESLDEALNVLKQTVKTFIEQGPTEDELKLSKQNLRGKFVLKLDNNQAIANYLSVVGYYNLPLDYIQRFKQNIDKVTVEDIQRAFQSRVNLKDWAIITVGNS